MINMLILLLHHVRCSSQLICKFLSLRLGVAVSFFVAEKNGRMAKEIIEILNRTTQNVPNELHSAAMSAPRGGGGRGRGRGGRRF